MADMFADVITKREMVHELEREIAMRRTVYGRRVAERKMNQAIADRQIAVMKAILRLVEDTQLIAAAPDLLAALEGLIENAQPDNWVDAE